VKTKVCTKCKEEKPLSEFRQAPHHKDGLTSWCKYCLSEQDKENYKNNIPKYLLRSIKQRCYNPNLDNRPWYYDKKIKCLITEEEIKRLMVRDNYYNLKQPSIDRKDSNKDYTFDNCCFLELGQNVRKTHSRVIMQFDKQGNFIKEFPSIAEANKTFGVIDSHINEVANNKPKYKSAFGYIWRYK